MAKNEGANVSRCYVPNLRRFWAIRDSASPKPKMNWTRKIFGRGKLDSISSNAFHYLSFIEYRSDQNTTVPYGIVLHPWYISFLESGVATNTVSKTKRMYAGCFSSFSPVTRARVPKQACLKLCVQICVWKGYALIHFKTESKAATLNPRYSGKIPQKNCTGNTFVKNILFCNIYITIREGE